MMKEVWKPIPCYEGLYEGSNLGRVKSLPRYVTNTKYGSSRLVRERLLTPCFDTRGYVQYTLSKKQVVRSKRAHRIVAELFIPNPNNLPEVNHRDGNKLNNRVDNLEWCTRKENNDHRINILGNLPRGEEIHNSKLKSDDIPTIRGLHKAGMSCNKIAKIYSISASSIQLIVKHESWGHIQ